MTLNLLRASRRNQKLSAYAILEGEYNFNHTPLEPPRARAQIYTDQTIRTSWAPHSKDAWYIGPEMQHYICYKLWVPKTRGTRISQTATFSPEYAKMSAIAKEDMAILIAKDLVDTLTQPQNKQKNLTLQHRDALKQFSEIFNDASTSARVRKNNEPLRVSNNKSITSPAHDATSKSHIKQKNTSSPKTNTKQYTYTSQPTSQNTHSVTGPYPYISTTRNRPYAHITRG